MTLNDDTTIEEALEVWEGAKETTHWIVFSALLREAFQIKKDEKLARKHRIFDHSEGLANMGQGFLAAMILLRAENINELVERIDRISDTLLEESPAWQRLLRREKEQSNPVKETPSPDHKEKALRQAIRGELAVYVSSIARGDSQMEKALEKALENSTDKILDLLSIHAYP